MSDEDDGKYIPKDKVRQIVKKAYEAGRRDERLEYERRISRQFMLLSGWMFESGKYDVTEEEIKKRE